MKIRTMENVEINSEEVIPVSTTVYDQYAAAALSALITKLPLLDRDGEIGGKPMPQDELDAWKSEIARSAHGYAMFMVEERTKFVGYLKSKGSLYK